METIVFDTRTIGRAVCLPVLDTDADLGALFFMGSVAVEESEIDFCITELGEAVIEVWTADVLDSAAVCELGRDSEAM